MKVNIIFLNRVGNNVVVCNTTLNHKFPSDTGDDEEDGLLLNSGESVLLNSNETIGLNTK